MPSRAICAEIGVDKGEYSQLILEATNPETLYLVDPFRFNSDECHRWNMKAKNQKEMDSRFQYLKERYKDEARVRIIRHTSEAAELPELDWIYIDGDHRYEAVSLDLKLAYERVKKGGYITGDDYMEGNWFEGAPKKAVDDFVKETDVKLIYTGNNQFVIKK